MSKCLKRLTAAGTVLCFLGIGVITFGAMMGGTGHLDQVMIQADGWDGTAEKRTLDHLPDFAQKDFEMMPLSQESYGNVSFIELELRENRVEIRESAEVEPGTVMIAREEEECEKYQIKHSEDKLKIEPPHWKDKERPLENIILYVPEKFWFEEIEIENNGGSFWADRIYAEEFSLEVSGGDAVILGGSVRRMDAECNAGSIDCQALIEKEAAAECKAGEVYFMMADPMESYDYDLEYHAGSIVLNGQPPMEWNGVGGQKKDYGAGRRVSLECSAGSIVVGYPEPAI